MPSCGAPAAPDSVGLLQKCIPLPGSTPPERGLGGAHLPAHRQVIRVTPMEAFECMKCVHPGTQSAVLASHSHLCGRSLKPLTPLASHSHLCGTCVAGPVLVLVCIVLLIVSC